MWRTLTAINKNLTLAIPVTMMVGFAYGVLGDTAFLKNLIIPFTFLMVYPMMVTLKIRSVLEGGDTRAQLMTQAINFLVIPFVAYGIGKIFFTDRPFLALGLLLASLVPTSGMTISWTGFAKGNLAAAVKMTVVGLILGSLLTPLYIRFLMGAQVDVDMISVMKQILVVVFLPMLAGYATQRWAVKHYGQKPFQELIAPRFPALSTVGVLGIVFIAIALKARSVADSPALLVTILLPLLLLYLCNYLLSTLVGNSGTSLAVIVDETWSLARQAAADHKPDLPLVKRIAAIFERDSRWLETLGPKLPPDQAMTARGALELLPPDLWWNALALIVRMLPGAGPDSFSTDYGDAPPNAPHRVFEPVIDSLNNLLGRARSVLLVDWKFNREVNNVVRRFRAAMAPREATAVSAAAAAGDRPPEKAPDKTPEKRVAAR